VDRALNLDLLRSALVASGRLPSPEELQDLLLAAEIALFIGADRFDERLLEVGWYLHTVATEPSTNDVAPARRGEAARVSAHIFDVYLQQRGDDLEDPTYRRYSVASQIGYVIGDAVPNAQAVGSRREFDSPSVVAEPGLAALHAAHLLLGMDLPALGQFLSLAGNELQGATVDPVVDVEESPWAAAAATLNGIQRLHAYLALGDAAQLAAAQNLFAAAINSAFARADTDSRWVAALLSDFGTAFAAASVWALLPPDHPEVQRAFTLGSPPVVLLWPPQAELLRSVPGPFEADVRRLVLSFPTSAGKTLLAQMLICHHVAGDVGDVCFVAPTHSLCREVKVSLDARLTFLGTAAFDAGGGGDPSSSDARVHIVTPERLSAMLRADPVGTLDRYTMFVVDEAHLLAEENRGWGLEEALSLLHYLTRGTQHRLVVMSAALGNSAHVAQWLATDDQPLTHTSDWRGPRRLQVLYTPEPDWDAAVEIQEGNAEPRRLVPLDGRIRLRPNGFGLMSSTFGNVGHLRRRWSPKKAEWVYESGGTLQVDQLLPMVHHLVMGAGQPCLVVVASRRDAKHLASSVAAGLPDLPANAGLADLVRTRLPAGHVLPGLVAKGVAYHHGVLPSDIQAEIEEAARRRQIRCLVATTTLTEGVNLPFKSVVIGPTGWGSTGKGTRQEIIDTARLLNAFGRAGRACRETEGWLFFSRFEKYQSEHFDVFDRAPADLEVISTLATDQAVAALNAFDQVLAEGVDAVFEDCGIETNGFCSYVWFLADALAQLNNGRPLGPQVAEALRSTLAWRQFDAEQQQRWFEVARTSYRRYLETDSEVRSRWSRTGTSLHSARILESLAATFAERARGSSPTSATDWLALLLADGAILTIVQLPENHRFRGIRAASNRSLEDPLPVDLLDLLNRWVSGEALEAIADGLLGDIEDEDFRADVLTEFVAAVFEHHLPWVLRTLVTWANRSLPTEQRIPWDLPAHVRHGVPSPAALDLMLSGVRSRRLATAVASELGPDDPIAVRSRLRQMTVEQWREAFGAAPTELKDLLSIIQDPSLPPVARLLDGDTVYLPVLERGPLPMDGTVVAISPDVGLPEPRPWIVKVGATTVGEIPAAFHDHVRTLLSLGQSLTIQIESTVMPRLAISSATSG
jgi:superfamily II DNA/RNA helicase